MSKRTIVLSCSALALLLLAGCAPGAHPAVGASGAPAGFWQGLWHGFIMLFTFIVSLFSDSVGVYEVHNNGNWYNMGYLLGVMFFFGGSCGGACNKSW